MLIREHSNATLVTGIQCSGGGNSSIVVVDSTDARIVQNSIGANTTFANIELVRAGHCTIHGNRLEVGSGHGFVPGSNWHVSLDEGCVNNVVDNAFATNFTHGEHGQSFVRHRQGLAGRQECESMPVPQDTVLTLAGQETVTLRGVLPARWDRATDLVVRLAFRAPDGGDHVQFRLAGSAQGGSEHALTKFLGETASVLVPYEGGERWLEAELCLEQLVLRPEDRYLEIQVERGAADDHSGDVELLYVHLDYRSTRSWFALPD